MNEKDLLALGYRKYAGEEIDVYYHKDICEHAGKCVHGDPAVFEVGRKPWIIPLKDHTQSIVDIVAKCPSGALKYKYKHKDEILPL